MSNPRIAGFEFDERSERKMAEHSVRAREALQVLAHPHRIEPNRKHRSATYLVIGQADGGRFLTLPIVPTADPTVWHPLTAWDSKKTEIARFQQMRRRRG